MTGNRAKPTKIDPSNIQRPKVEKTSAEDQKVLEEIRKKIREQKEQEMRELEDEVVKQYLSQFFVDRHKKVQKDRDVIINVPQIEVKSDASPGVNLDVANLIDISVASQINTKFDAMSENFTKLFGQLDAKVNQVLGGMTPINHIHSRITIGGSAGEGNTTTVTNAMMPHKVVYNEPPMSTVVPLSNISSSLHHSIPNQSPQRVDTP
ncbi:unnamed protein product [Urochloa humidicola]